MLRPQTGGFPDMKRIVEGLVGMMALGVLAHALPARACDAHQKTTMAKAEKTQPDERAQPEKAARSKESPKDAQAQKTDRGAQAKNVAGAERAAQR